MTDRSLRTLDRPPALAPLLARGALASPFKKAALNRPRPNAALPDTPLLGTRLVLPGVRIDLARLAAYERVCGFPVGDDALPVTYPHVLGFPLAMLLMTERSFPLPLLGLVHTSVEIARRRPLAANGTYELSVYVDELAPHRRGTEASVRTEVREGDELAWESRSTYLARHRSEASGAGARAADGQVAGARVVGDEPEALPLVTEWRLGEDIGRRYATASGDRNPIHLHALTARLFGFRRAIAHGMWTAARCLAAHGTPESALVRTDFRAPVLLPGTVEYGADGAGNFELRGGGRVHLRGAVRGAPL
ncbi:MaoC family dehydratase [Streptomyces turgidiscabies]|uniref:MaoC-like protein n=1 Tax=Streptomyces turgidiscabies (strain Car8) TaxID=698760 RepID=L7EX09_STRT8|nr:MULTISPECIES: MaoC/PaaZ C-terminal domain-containing protein [Streptomyces]ELP63948.1 MaoC-like protein [Streptomyces turgidiscabies Car8]MDX3498649.1 MaoC/PaaZ C-terminal domain-containing protein [Streptomyces turgidiscabies]GAQ74927.1 MaoC like domain protein [Streptomyces turgidiscabies]